jgi:zinc transporter ZupT
MSFIALFTATLSSLVGLLFLKFRPSEGAMHILVGVGAGIMTSISLTDILPESSEVIESAGIFFFIGFCAVFLLDYLHCTHPHVGHSEHHDHSHEHSHSLPQNASTTSAYR